MSEEKAPALERQLTPAPILPPSPTAAVKFARKIEREIAEAIIASLFLAIEASPISSLALIAQEPALRQELERIICDILPIDVLVEKTEKCCEDECPSCWTRFCQRLGFCSKSKPKPKP
jgi:hypothetical protein